MCGIRNLGCTLGLMIFVVTFYVNKQDKPVGAVMELPRSRLREI